MKLLILNYEFPPLGGGAATASEQFAKELSRLGYEVRVLTTWFLGLSKVEQTKDGYTIHRVPARRKRVGSSNPLGMLLFVQKAWQYRTKILNEFKPDHIIAFFGIPSGLVAYLIKRRYLIPYTVMLRGGDVPGMMPEQLRWWHMIAGPMIRLVWRSANLLIANSQGLQQLAQKTATPIGKDVKIILNGVDTELFQPGEHNNKNGVIRILAVGRLDAYKGFDVLLHAVAQLYPLARRRFRVDIVGDGPLLMKFRQMNERLLPHQDVVHFLGRKNREEIVSLLKMTHIFLHPSQGESMSNAILEAMACGLPVIAADVGGNRELVQNNVNGILVNKNSVVGFRDALLSLIDNKDLCQGMGEQGRKISEKFNWRESSIKLMSLIGGS